MIAMSRRRSMPMLSSIWVRSWPDLPTKGMPCRSSSLPGLRPQARCACRDRPRRRRRAGGFWPWSSTCRPAQAPSSVAQSAFSQAARTSGESASLGACGAAAMEGAIRSPPERAAGTGRDGRYGLKIRAAIPAEGRRRCSRRLLLRSGLQRGGLSQAGAKRDFRKRHVLCLAQNPLRTDLEGVPHQAVGNAQHASPPNSSVIRTACSRPSAVR